MNGTLLGQLGAADNLGDEEPVLNRRSVILGITISFQLLTWMCALFRLYTRFFIIKSPWWDDLFLLLSTLSTQAGGIAVCLATNSGLGQHFVLLSNEQVVGYLKAFYVANATYPGSTAFIKLALLFQYLRMYEKGSRLYLTLLGVIIFTSLWGLAYSVLAWVPTVPISGFWHLDAPAVRYGYGTQYVDAFTATYESHAAVNMLLDAVVLGIAVPLFFKPGMRSTSYWGLLGLFALGGIVNMLSIWRLQSIVETQATTLPTFDPTWYGTTPIVLSSMEVDLATICASCPVFWPVLKNNLGPYIMVTHEVKITREVRGPGGLDDDNLELRHQRSEGMLSSGDIMSVNRSSNGSVEHYRNSFTSKQKSDHALSAGRMTSMRVRIESDTKKETMV